MAGVSAIVRDGGVGRGQVTGTTRDKDPAAVAGRGVSANGAVDEIQGAEVEDDSAARIPGTVAAEGAARDVRCNVRAHRKPATERAPAADCLIIAESAVRDIYDPAVVISSKSGALLRRIATEGAAPDVQG